MEEPHLVSVELGLRRRFVRGLLRTGPGQLRGSNDRRVNETHSTP